MLNNVSQKIENKYDMLTSVPVYAYDDHEMIENLILAQNDLDSFSF